MSQLGLDDSPDYIPQQLQSKEMPSALGGCPDCGHPISRRAESCPHCGSPLRVRPQQPTLGRIAGGVILGYLGILIINIVLFFIVLTFFAGIFSNALSNTSPTKRPTSVYP